MKTKILEISSKSFIALSVFSLASVSFMAILNPQDVMDLVGVKLENTDAYSSIRGIYGGVGFSIAISLIISIFKAPTFGLGFLSMFWGFYALSRFITHINEGALGDFGSQWILIETLFFVIAGLLFIARKRAALA